MAEAKSEETDRSRKKVSEMLPSELGTYPPDISFSDLTLVKSKGLLKEAWKKVSSGVHKSSSFHSKWSAAKMVNEDPIRLNCVINKDTVKMRNREKLTVYSSSARLPTFSIGLASTRGEVPSQAPVRESHADPKDKSPPRYFLMPELGARVFIGNGSGLDTITCHLFNRFHNVSKSHLDPRYATIKTLYEYNRPDRLKGWLQAQSKEFFWRYKDYSEVILSGTELFVGRGPCVTVVGNLGRKRSRGSGSISDYEDCTSDKTIKKPPMFVHSVERRADPMLGGLFNHLDFPWNSVEDPHLCRSTKGSYLEKPKFLEDGQTFLRLESGEWNVLQLTKFDDFIILGDQNFYLRLHSSKVVDIVQQNASKTADVIATQLVKSAIKNPWREDLYQVTVIVILLDHNEIMQREHKKEKKDNMAKAIIATFGGLLGEKGSSQSTILKDDKNIVELKEEEKIFEEKTIDKKRIKMEEDYKVKILGEPLPNVPQTSMILLEEEELGMKSIAISSNLPSTKVQDDLKASSSKVLSIDDDYKSKDFMDSYDITKWIIYGGIQERTLLCIFREEEKQYEFYFEDHESMATIIGLGVPHSKIILEHGSSNVTIVEIQEEDWNFIWAHSNVIPFSVPQGYVLKQEQFPNILHNIMNVLNIDSIGSKANNVGAREDSGKNKAQDNTYDNKGKGKAYDQDEYGNIGHPNGDSNGFFDDSDKKERKEEDGNNDRKNGRNHDDGRTSKDCKEVQAVVYLRLLPGGVLEEKEKKKESQKELVESHEEDIEGNGKAGKGCKKVEKKKKKYKGFCFPLKQGKNGNFVENQHNSTTIEGIENGDVEEEVLEGKEKKRGEIHEEVEEKKMEGHEEEAKVKKKEFGEIYKEMVERKKKQLEEGHKGVEQKKKKQVRNRNLVGNHQKSTTIMGIENGDVDESLKKQLENQIHSQMVFTFTIKDEAGGQLKTIQATVGPITFQLPSNNKENYLQWRWFGWFHDYLQVAFGVVNAQVSILETNSCKALDSFEAKEIVLQGISQGNVSTLTTEMKGEGGLQYIGRLLFKYSRAYGSGTQTNEELKTALETKKILTNGGDFTILEHTDHNTHQLKYSYRPLPPFKEEDLIHEDDFLKMYDKPICQLLRVSCEGTWNPDCSENLEPYKLEASRELQMTRICNLEPKIGKEEKRKLLWKAKPFCFIQKLEKIVYLNHAMSHVTSSTSGKYRLQERQDPSKPSTTTLTQAQRKEKLEWPGNDRLIDVHS